MTWQQKIARGWRRSLRAPSQGRARRLAQLSSTVAAAAALQSSRAAAAAALVGGRGEAWPPVVLPSVGTPVKRQPSEGELLQWAPHTKIHHHLDHHLSHTFPGRTRPKKEDWLKKKDRKQRRPGCRRKKRKRK